MSSSFASIGRLTEHTRPEDVPVRSLATFIDMAHSTDVDIAQHGVLIYHKLFLAEHDRFQSFTSVCFRVASDEPARDQFDVLIDDKMVDRLVSLLERDDCEALQFRAASALSEIFFTAGCATNWDRRYFMGEEEDERN